MKKYSFYDVFFVVSLILAVATRNAIYSLVIVAIASVLELLDVGKVFYKEYMDHGQED